MPDQISEYDRGVTAGQVAARLDSHEKHLAKINGSMEGVRIELATMSHTSQEVLLAIQRLQDSANSDRATVITTATALEKAEQARRDKSTSGWTPFQRVIAVVTVLAAVAGVIAYFVTAAHG